jgi:hypothetical protein
MEKVGFLRVRQKGSHVIMQKQMDGSTITVPVPMHATLRIGTLRLHPHGGIAEFAVSISKIRTRPASVKNITPG